MEIIHNLINDISVRHRTVLVLYGTGVNIWHYYPFLKRFTIDDLNDFSAIYGISGGAVCLWYHILSKIYLFQTDNIPRFDKELRALNEGTIFHRLVLFLLNKYAYDANKLADRIDTFATPQARRLLFRDCPIRNFTAVGYDSLKNAAIELNAGSTPDLPMGDVMASISFPSKVLGRRLCRPIDFGSLRVSDIDFHRAARRKFIAEVKERHSDRLIIIINLFFLATKGNVIYCKLTNDRYPSFCQFYDLLLFLLDIPNGRISRSAGYLDNI